MTPNHQKLELYVDNTTARAIAARFSNLGLSPETVAHAALAAFASAPPTVATYIAGLRGGQGNVWENFAQHVRSGLKNEFADELKLAELIRTIATKKDRQ